MGTEAVNELGESTLYPAPETTERDPVEWARQTIMRSSRDYEAIVRALKELNAIVGSLKKVLTATATFDPPNLAAGAQTTTTVTVTGAALGDLVIVSFSLDLQAIQLVGYVSAANTVTAVFQNGTAGAIDLGSGTLRALVLQV